MGAVPYPTPPDTDLTYALVSEDVCPQCLEDLDEGWECIMCGFDAYDYLEGLHERE